MSEHERYKNKNSFSKDTPDTAATLKKMQYQLDAIERKIDSLSQQSGARDFRNRGASKSYREHDNTKRPFKVKHVKRKAAASSEGKFYHKLTSPPKKNASKGNFGTKKRS